MTSLTSVPTQAASRSWRSGVSRRPSRASAARGVVTLPVVRAHEHARDGGSQPDQAAGEVPGQAAAGPSGAHSGQAAGAASGAHASGGDISSGPANEGVIDLLGLLAYASLVAFFRLADD